jgi:hypothetical protein
MSTNTKRAALVIVAFLAFTIWAIGRRGGLILSAHGSPMMVGFVAADALHRVLILLAASMAVCVPFYWHQRGERQPRS